MKPLFALTLVLIIFCPFANATNYYFSTSGNDANNGTTTSTPWQTIAKFNSVFASKSPGDNFLFNRGDVFYGTLIISRSGSVGLPITIGAYGTGANPVITGFTAVTSWTNLGSNIWESTSAISTLSTCNKVIINGTDVPMGRSPQTGFFTISSATSTSITSPSLNSAVTNWTGGQVVVKIIRDLHAISTISSASGSTINFGSITTPTAGWGFFIQNNVQTLTYQNAWYYNSSTKKIRIYSTVSPANVQVSTVPELVTASGRSYVTFDGLYFTGSNASAIHVTASSHNITVSNCTFVSCGQDGFQGDGVVTNVNLTNNTAYDCNNAAFASYDGAVDVNWSITGNTTLRTGLNLGMRQARAFGAIHSIGDNCLIQYNNVDSSGYSGIQFIGNHVRCLNNFINHSTMVLDDGGGIYTNGTGTQKVIAGNIVLNSIGAPSGTNQPAQYFGNGIYLDDNSTLDTVINNTSAGNSGSGILLHNGANNYIRNNTCYDNYNIAGSGIDRGAIFMEADAGSTTPFRNNKINANIFFSKQTVQYSLFYWNQISAADTKLYGTSDSNYYAKPIDSSQTLRTFIGSTTTFYNLNQWRTFATQDAHSNITPLPVSDINYILFKYNATSSPVTFSLPYNCIDVKNVSYSGSITLQPYTSAILIKNGVTINQPPIAKAGPDQVITLPTNSLTLSGSGSDPDGNISSYNWLKISGPSTYNITNPSLPGTSVTNLVQGTYQFQLKVTDNSGAPGTDTMQVTVNAAPNQPPAANAGSDQSITLPSNTVTLSGSATDPDGTISSYNWIKISGPSSGTITNAGSASTSVTGLVQGIYQFQLTVTDNNGATGTDVVLITVNAAANITPVANAGLDQSITLPVNTITLSGSGSDADGTVTNYNWTEISGPSSYNIVNANSPLTDVDGLVQGVYQFQLTVTDNSGAIGTDIIQITVNPAVNIPPIANGGLDQAIILPANSVTLSGNGSDADGTISYYNWSKISGPSTCTITSPNSASTSVAGLIQGVYQYQLKVTDNSGAASLDTMQVTVIAANIPPTATAGIDQAIILPVNTVILAGTGTDVNGTIAAYNWVKISGPSACTITSLNSASTSVTGLTQGIYQYQLKVTDNSGATGSDTVQVTVNAAINLPIANAGPDQSITLPTNSTSLSGSAIEAKGIVRKYKWTKISGPTATIVSPNSRVTSIKGLLEGTYKFQLAVTDNKGATGNDSMQINVTKAVLASNFINADITNAESKTNKNVVYQNFPNPVINTTTIRYEISEKAPVKIIVFNAAGIKVGILANEIKQPGSYQVQWNAANLPSGNYFYTVIIGNDITTKKMLKVN